MIKLGHRGARGHEPENTLRSFKKAMELGANMIEFDVHVCSSGEVVVIHDEELERTTNGKGKVAEKTLIELKELDAGKGEKIPTLEEILDFIDRKCRLDIELKGKGTPKPVADILEKSLEQGWKPGDFLVTSFEHETLLKPFHDECPKIPIGLLFRKIPEDFADKALAMDAELVALYHKNVTPETIKKAHSKGLKVIVWTVNEKEDMDKLKRWGADGIGSDFPDRL